jgi:hypothetical protein
MVRFMLVGLIALSTVPGLSLGQHLFDCAEAYTTYLNRERADAKLEPDRPAGSGAPQGIKHLMLGLVEGRDASSNHEPRSSSAVPSECGALVLRVVSLEAYAINMTGDVPPAANALSLIYACAFAVSSRFMHTRISSAPRSLN